MPPRPDRKRHVSTGDGGGPISPLRIPLDRTPVQPGLISAWVKALSTPTRGVAVDGLTQFVVDRLAAHTELIDRTTVGLRPVLEWGDIESRREAVCQALFDRADPADAPTLYRNAAAAIRRMIGDRITRWLDTGDRSTPPALRLMWWHEFHRAADDLTGLRRQAHDLVWYCGRIGSQAAAILCVPTDAIDQAAQEADAHLREYFDAACGTARPIQERPA